MGASLGFDRYNSVLTPWVSGCQDHQINNGGLRFERGCPVISGALNQKQVLQ